MRGSYRQYPVHSTFTLLAKVFLKTFASRLGSKDAVSFFRVPLVGAVQAVRVNAVRSGRHVRVF